MILFKTKEIWNKKQKRDSVENKMNKIEMRINSDIIEIRQESNLLPLNLNLIL